MSFCRIDNKPIRTHEPVTEPDALERFLGDEALRKGWQVPVDAAPTGKRVLVVGAGPSGLSAAYHLARMDHSVTIKDAGAAAGGMMRYGIPKYPAATRHPGRRDQPHPGHGHHAGTRRDGHRHPG